MILNRYAVGFTLTELLFAMAVGSIVVLAASAFMGHSSEGYRRVTGTIATEREARALWGELSTELSSAVFHEDMVAANNLSAWPGGRLAYLTLRPGDSQEPAQQIGDLCAVHYYVGDRDVGGRAMRCVMRGSRDSKEVFDALHHDDVHGLFVPDPVVDEPIAMGVLAFEVLPQRKNAMGHWEDAPVPMSDAPAAVKVRLVVVRSPLAGRMRSSEDWDASTPGLAHALGDPEDAGSNPHLQIFESIFPFSAHGSP
jgi:prepilin-type N-terminal cleavage/methylation domain-containing protein